MKTVVIYKSTYGYTEKYAKWIAKSLSCDILNAKNVKEAALSAYDVIIYGGGLYAEGIAGIKLLTNNKEIIKDKKIIIFACGLADPSDKEYSNGLHKNVNGLFSPVDIHFFHLRGGMDYSKLGFFHKLLLKMFFKMLSKKPDNELTAEQKDIIQSYGKSVDYTDENAILPIVECVKNL